MTNVIKIHAKKLEDMSDAEITIAKYRSLEARYNSMVEAAQSLEFQNNKFRSEIEVSYVKLENAQKNVDINKAIVMKTVTDSNSNKASYLGEIADLKEKLNRA